MLSKCINVARKEAASEQLLFTGGPVPGLLTPELFPPALRARGASVGMVSHWGWNTLVGAAFLPLVTKFSVPAIYGGFAAVAVAGAAFAKYGVPETTGKAA